jgi:hypothetical protein
VLRFTGLGHGLALTDLRFEVALFGAHQRKLRADLRSEADPLFLGDHLRV